MNAIGEWIRVSPGDSAEISITATRFEADKVHVSGMALWGESREYGPNIGELDFSAHVENGVIQHSEPAGDELYQVTMKIDGDTMIVTEGRVVGHFGMNVYFEGEYRRAPSSSRVTKILKRFFAHSKGD